MVLCNSGIFMLWDNVYNELEVDEMNKIFVIEDKHINIINEVKAEKFLKNDSETLRFILEEYEKTVKKEKSEDEFIEKLLEAYHQKYYKLLERLRWASQTAEKNSTLLLDAVNTILLLNDISDGVMTDTFISPVLEMSENAYKEKIAYFKQMKDDRKRRNEEEKQ